LASQKELLANVSHELRTPVARIAVVVEMALDASSPELLAEISTDLKELEKLLEEILEFARLDFGDLSQIGHQSSFSPVPISLFEVAQNEVKKTRLLHPQRAIVLNGDRDSSIVAGEGHLLTRVVRNLLENAIKYSPMRHPIEVSIETSPTCVGLSVRDRGSGIDAADLPHVFMPFYRADKSRRSSTGGAGLGLALTKRIVERHGGEITLESAIHEGTTARVILPIYTPRSTADRSEKE
jgi:signal transduction histidine kinase